MRGPPLLSMAAKRVMLQPTASGVQKSMATRRYARSGRSWATRCGDQMSRLPTSAKQPCIWVQASEAATMPDQERCLFSLLLCQREAAAAIDAPMTPFSQGLRNPSRLHRPAVELAMTRSKFCKHQLTYGAHLEMSESSGRCWGGPSCRSPGAPQNADPWTTVHHARPACADTPSSLHCQPSPAPLRRLPWQSGWPPIPAHLVEACKMSSRPLSKRLNPLLRRTIDACYLQACGASCE